MGAVHRWLRGAGIAVLVGPCLASIATSGARADGPVRRLAEHLESGDRLLGDPGGARSALQRLGVDLQLFYDQFLSVKAAGGGANPDAALGASGSYDFFTRVDLDALSGWRGADVLLHVKGQYDRGLNADVGALSDPIDDADFDAGIYVDELWLQQAVLGDRLRARIGFAEQQTIFDRNAYANSEDRQFLTTYLDNNGVVPLPNGLAATLIVAPVEWAELALGVADADNRPRNAGFDTMFDGWDSLAGYLEATLHSPLARRGLPGQYRLGFFVDGRERTDFRTGEASRGHLGAYLSFDQHLWPAQPRGAEGLGVFARMGYADRNVNRVAWFWSVGLQYAGALPGRARDVLGFGVYQAIGSTVYRDAANPDFDRETGIEIYYALRALGWLVITPDLQYVVDPGATGADNAFIATLRLRVTF